MKDILLLGKKIVADKSPVIFKYEPDADWEKFWTPKSGTWGYENGFLIGEESGNFGGILFSKESFEDDVMFSFTIGTVLPATRDVNAVFCAKWDEEKDYLGESYVCGNQIFKYDVEDAGAVIMKLENGAIAYVDANFNIPDAAAKCKIEFYGTKGSIFAQGTISQVEGVEIEVYCADDSAGYDANQDRNEVTPVDICVEFGNMYTKEIEAFGRAVMGECEVPITAKDAIMSQKIVEAAYQSNKTKTYETF